MFRLSIFNQIYTEVALERSAHTAQSAPCGSSLELTALGIPAPTARLF